MKLFLVIIPFIFFVFLLRVFLGTITIGCVIPVLISFCYGTPWVLLGYIGFGCFYLFIKMKQEDDPRIKEVSEIISCEKALDFAITGKSDCVEWIEKRLGMTEY